MSKLIHIKQLWQLTLAHFRELIREPGVLFWGIGFPVLMSLGLGFAFTSKSDVIRKIAVISTDDTTGYDSLSLISFFNKNCKENLSDEKDDFRWRLEMNDDKLGNSVFLFYTMSWDKALVLLKRGTVNLILKENNRRIEYHFDPVNSDAELTYLKLSSIIGSGKIISESGNTEIKPLTITGTRYIDFLVPGLITMGVMMSTMWGLSYGLIEKRSKKLLRRLVATPMKKSHFLIALITVRLAMNFFEALVILVFGIITFKITIQGSISAMILIFLAGNIAFAGIAVFASSHTSNTEVGNGIINTIVMPMMILSGIFFSYHNFPDWSIPVIQKLPLTMLTDGIRSIFNEGGGYHEVALPVLILTTIGIIFFGTGLKIFKWH